MQPVPSKEKDALSFLTGQGQDCEHPRAVGEKFSQNGQVLRFSGNTILCHIPGNTVGHAALVEAQKQLRATAPPNAFAFLPPASLHMTVFEGVNDNRRTEEYWPAHLPRDMTLKSVTDDFATRLQGVHGPSGLQVRASHIFAGHSVRVSGVNEGHETLLRDMRDTLKTHLNIRRRDHYTYAFHITLAYLLHWLSPEEARDVHAASSAIGEGLRQAAPAISLGPVELCTFNTMAHFAPYLPLTRG